MIRQQEENKPGWFATLIICLIPAAILAAVLFAPDLGGLADLFR